MKKETLKGVELTIVTDDIDGMGRDQLTEGLGLRKSGDKQFIFTKAPRQRVSLRRNPRIYSGTVVHSSLRKDGKYGISAVVVLEGDLALQHKIARVELDEVFEKLGVLA